MELRVWSRILKDVVSNSLLGSGILPLYLTEIRPVPVTNLIARDSSFLK